MAEIDRQRQHVAGDIAPLGRERAFERANCECVAKVMKARPRLAWPGSKPDPPCQLDEDGCEIDRVHGPARREHEQVVVGPAAALPLPQIHLHGPMDAARDPQPRRAGAIVHGHHEPQASRDTDDGLCRGAAGERTRPIAPQRYRLEAHVSARRPGQVQQGPLRPPLAAAARTTARVLAPQTARALAVSERATRTSDDTDPIQAEIFWRLCRDPQDDGNPADWTSFQIRRGALFVVGDPKQAILRFRGAEVATYVRAREAFRGHAPDSILEITTDFRSRADSQVRERTIRRTALR